MSAPARGWVALENVVTREWVALQAMPAMGQKPVEVVRADVADELLGALEAALDLGLGEHDFDNSVTLRMKRAIAKAKGTS